MGKFSLPPNLGNNCPDLRSEVVPSDAFFLFREIIGQSEFCRQDQEYLISLRTAQASYIQDTTLKFTYNSFYPHILGVLGVPTLTTGASVEES